MRFLIVDYMYDAFVRSVYDSTPGLADDTYETQKRRVDAGLFGETQFEVAALRAQGHEAEDHIANVKPMLRAWYRENGLRFADPQWGLRLRRGLVPWPKRTYTRWMGEALLARVRRFKPDVVHIAAMDLLEPKVVAAVRAQVPLVVGQVATELPSAWTYRDYDLVVSSIPDLVDRFRREGANAEWLPLAFEPAVRAAIPEVQRDVSVSFVGSFSTRYADRVQLIEAVARAAPLQTWTGDGAAVPVDSPIRPTLQGPAWGRAMYEVLARSRITVNTHGRIAGDDANNLRLFEATGMGTLLVTDARRNMSQLFKTGSEVVTYSDARECTGVVRHFLDHPAEATAIAAAGQRRTMRDHTWANRMARLTELVTPRVRRRH
jgi:spore maturation protein CgeB